MTNERFYFIVDTETGGLPESNPSLLTIDGILADSNLDVVDTISLKLRPADGNYRVNAKGMEVNGIDLVTHDKVADVASDVAGTLTDLFKKHVGPDAYFQLDPFKKQRRVVPCGQYLSFDMHFLKKELPQLDPRTSLEGIQYDWHHYLCRRGLDTAAVAQFLVLQDKLPVGLDCSLKSLAGHFGYDYTGAHNSAFDAELTRKVLKDLLAL